MADQIVNLNGLQLKYSRLECWVDKNDGRFPSALGIPYHLWSLGMTAFNLRIDHMLGNRLSRLKDCDFDLCPQVYEGLRVDNFPKKLTQAFPNAG